MKEKNHSMLNYIDLKIANFTGNNYPMTDTGVGCEMDVIPPVCGGTQTYQD